MAKSKIVSKIRKRSRTKGQVSIKTLIEGKAFYNPRVITSRELQSLKTSYETYGDLSGIVFNIATGTLVSGHQRLKTLEGKKAKIEKSPHRDAYGTTALGNIVILEKDETITKIPYREVDWSKATAEMAANIAANAGGGQFDNDKLASMLEELDLDDEFLIESIGLDPLSIRQLTSHDSNASSSSDGEEEFPEYDETNVELKNKCPKCNYEW